MTKHISVRLRENLGEKIDEVMTVYDEKFGLDLSRNYIVNMLLKAGYELEIKKLQSLKSA